MGESSDRLNHLGGDGKARMVNVGEKPHTTRKAVAEGRVWLGPEVFELVRDGRMAKGEVLGTARLAGIQAAKKTSEWIPLCHPIPLNLVDVDLHLESSTHAVIITATAEARWSTGVEMEAMTAVAAAALTVYDMCKSAKRGIRIERIHLKSKSGGQSGDYRAEEA